MKAPAPRWRAGRSFSPSRCCSCPRASAWTQPTSGEPGIPPAIGFVNDRAGVMDETTRARLEAFLDQVKTTTGAESAVLTVDSTAPLLPSEYKVQVFQRWGLGQKHEDNGLLLLVAMKEREAWFEDRLRPRGRAPRRPAGSHRARADVSTLPRWRCLGLHRGGRDHRRGADRSREGRDAREWDGRELRYSGGSESGRLPPWVAPLIFFLLLISVLAPPRVRRLPAPRPVGRALDGRRLRRLGRWLGRGIRRRWGGSFGGFGGGASGGGGGGGHLVIMRPPCARPERRER